MVELAVAVPEHCYHRGVARRHPPADVVHRVHDRYLVEVVEGLGLCPFARRSRELGRVHRPLFYVDGEAPSAAKVAAKLGATVRDHADAEIILLTFIDDGTRFAEPPPFETFVTAVRDAYATSKLPLWFMVAFHPRFTVDPERPLTKDSLVPLIRRSPDPVIQCVNAKVLERARAQAQEAAHRKLVETLGKTDPILKTMIENSVQADSELSADIARANFTAVGEGSGRDAFESLIADIQRDRDESYRER